MKTQQQQRCEGARWQGLGKTYRVFTVAFIGDHYGIVDDLVHNLLSHFISLQDPYSDTLVIGDDIEESDSATFSVITVCEESTMPAMVCAEVPSTGEGSETVSFQSHSSQASIPEEEISIWVDEMEEQNSKRQKLNEAVHSISGGRYSPVLSTLNTTWDDVSDTQQRYYLRKAFCDYSDLVVCHHCRPRGTGLEDVTNGDTFGSKQRQPRKAQAF